MMYRSEVIDGQRCLVETRLNFIMPVQIIPRLASLMYPGDRYIEKYFDSEKYDIARFYEYLTWEEFVVLSVERLDAGEWKVIAISTEDGRVDTKLCSIERFYVLEKLKPTSKSSYPPRSSFIPPST